jgi:hypothetical protein
MVRYRKELFFGCYADPDALPEVYELPGLIEAEVQALGRAAASRLNGSSGPAPAAAPVLVGGRVPAAPVATGVTRPSAPPEA